MKPIITYENLQSFAYSNDKLLTGEIKGIVLAFTGLGGQNMLHEDTLEGNYFAERGILYLFPYVNPWNWMNRRAAAFTDEIVDVVISHYGLPANIPIVSTGGSMGGQSALVYMAYAKRTPVACVANCPVCDLPFHFTERPDLPRTLYAAFYDVDGTVEEALATASPLHLLKAGKMPQAKYTIFHCSADLAVNKEAHSDRFVEAAKGVVPLTYYVVPDRGHCDLGEEMYEVYLKEIAQAVG